jgi:hypothetical protein
VTKPSKPLPCFTGTPLIHLGENQSKTPLGYKSEISVEGWMMEVGGRPKQMHKILS